VGHKRKDADADEREALAREIDEAKQYDPEDPLFGLTVEELSGPRLSRRAVLRLMAAAGVLSALRFTPGLESVAYAQGGERGEGDRVLIVDDDPGALLLARKVLLKGGYEVEEAGDGVEALERLGSEQGISLVVVDLNMPRLDGLELIWEIRAREGGPRIPIIVVTGETDEVLETKLIEEGADDYIRKPLDPRLFLARVAATIRRAEH